VQVNKWFENLIDNTLFLSHTRIGYILRRRKWVGTDTKVDLRGKMCMVTGACTGLGLAAAEGLAERGATVTMLTRDRDIGLYAQAAVIARTGNPNVFLEAVDLSNIAEIRQFAAQFQENESWLDVLINSEEVLLDQRQVSVDGIEMTFAYNVLGPFLLTELLLPMMKHSAPSRVIFVSSSNIYHQKLDVQDLQYEHRAFERVGAYEQAKRAQIILTELWAERLVGTGVTINAMHPGWVKTGMHKELLPNYKRWLSPFLRTPDQGADTILWLAVAPRLATRSGKFFFDRLERPTHKTERTRLSLQERRLLWETCVQLSGLTETG